MKFSTKKNFIKRPWKGSEKQDMESLHFCESVMAIKKKLSRRVFFIIVKMTKSSLHKMFNSLNETALSARMWDELDTTFDHRRNDELITFFCAELSPTPTMTRWKFWWLWKTLQAPPTHGNFYFCGEFVIDWKKSSSNGLKKFSKQKIGRCTTLTVDGQQKMQFNSSS